MVENGLPFDTAGNIYGLSKSSIYEWIRKGDAYIDSELHERNPNHLIFAVFSHSIKRARAIYFMGLVKSINDSSQENEKWNRDWKILSRRDSKNWGPGASKRQKENQEVADLKYL